MYQIATRPLPLFRTPYLFAIHYLLLPMKSRDADLSMEITILSAQDISNPSTLFLLRRRLRPFVAIFATASSLDSGGVSPPLHRTQVDNSGEQNPTWGDTFSLPLDPSFLLGGASTSEVDEVGLYLCVLSERPLCGPAKLGWCRIPPADVIDSLQPLASVRRLSYALRSPRHGGRGHGVIHVAVRLLGRDLERLVLPSLAPARSLPEEPVWGRVVIGIPVAPVFALPGCAGSGLGNCTGQIGRFGKAEVGLTAGFDFGSIKGLKSQDVDITASSLAIEDWRCNCGIQQRLTPA